MLAVTYPRAPAMSRGQGWAQGPSLGSLCPCKVSETPQIWALLGSQRGWGFDDPQLP